MQLQIIRKLKIGRSLAFFKGRSGFPGPLA
jgi:hypothetical protein